MPRPVPAPAPWPGPGGPPRLLLLTDRSQLSLGRSLVGTVAECVEAGLRAVVVREPDLHPRARHALLAALARLPGLVVISSRLPDPAAHGVHLAAHQRPGRWATSAAGPVVGRSCHAVGEVRSAAAEGAAYVVLSPFGVSLSKPGHLPPLPRTAYAEAADAGVPVLALGGIGRDDVAAALDAGAHGVAVMGAVMRARDPAAEVAALLARLPPTRLPSTRCPATWASRTRGPTTRFPAAHLTPARAPAARATRARELSRPVDRSAGPPAPPLTRHDGAVDERTARDDARRPTRPDLT
ncbi:thiamine phosphate synthase [Nocardioides kribbensis]|uniref:thiamine phosphate synthase n=1 Tax=Nocardioides kribbensis TaxID=305517 RepID=UPI0029D4137F|nr:thiamine phosphate synthase [Nocardioides kribbensis]